jgi:hypothetical protein
MDSRGDQARGERSSEISSVTVISALIKNGQQYFP